MTDIISTAAVVVEVTGARGPKGDTGPASGPLGAGSVTAATISDDAGEQQLIRDKLAIGGERLVADRTYYVRIDGSDSNTGLANTSGAAFATVQKAVDTAYTLLCSGKQVVVSVGDGTYTTPVVIAARLAGAKNGASIPLTIVGNEATPANVVFSTTAANALALADHASLVLKGVTCQTTTSGIGWSVGSHARLEHQNCRFGATANEMILCQQHSAVVAKGPLTVAGNAGSFVHATKRSLVDFAGQTIAFVGSPVFSTYLWGLNDSALNLDGATITGAKTGPITVHYDAFINATGVIGDYNGGVNLNVDNGGRIYITDLESNQMKFYVRPDGSDTNDGLSNTAARAFKTIQYAVNTVARREYDQRTYGGWDDVWDNCIIQLAAGTYNETVKLRNLQGYIGCTIKGDETTPGNVIIAGTGDGIFAGGIASKWAVKGVKITGASGSLMRLFRGSFVAFQNVEFGTATGGAHIFLEDGAQAIAIGNYSISGSASAHILARQSKVNISSRTVTITGTPALSNAFVYADDASAIKAVSVTFSGSATGKRYDSRGLSFVNTNGGGASYFPGDSAGSTTTSGVYA